MPLDMPQDMHHPEYKEQPKEPNKSEIVEVVNHTQKDLVDFLNNGPLKERGITAERGKDGSVILSGMPESTAETAETQQKDIETQRQQIKDSLHQEIQSISQEADPAEKQNMINRVLRKMSNLVDYVADSLGPAEANAGGVDLDAVMEKQEEEISENKEEIKKQNKIQEKQNKIQEKQNKKQKKLDKKQKKLDKEIAESKENIAESKENIAESKENISESKENISESKEKIAKREEFMGILDFLEEKVLVKGELNDSTKQEAEEKISRAETLMEEMDLSESQKEQINSILRVSKRKIN